MHLAAKHFVEGVNPTPARRLLSKVKKHLAAASDDDTTFDLEELEREIAELEGDGDEGIDDEDAEFDVSDTIGKALALVTQVNLFLYRSLHRRLNFHT